MRLGEPTGDGASSSSTPRPARIHREIAISPDLLAIAQCDATAAPETLGCTEAGLDDAAVAVRLKRFGANRAAQEQRTGIFYELVNRTRNPLNGLLLTLSVVSYFLGDARAAVVIASMVILSIAVRMHRTAVLLHTPDAGPTPSSCFLSVSRSTTKKQSTLMGHRPSRELLAKKAVSETREAAAMFQIPTIAWPRHGGAFRCANQDPVPKTL